MAAIKIHAKYIKELFEAAKTHAEVSMISMIHESMIPARLYVHREHLSHDNRRLTEITSAVLCDVRMHQMPHQNPIDRK